MGIINDIEKVVGHISYNPDGFLLKNSMKSLIEVFNQKPIGAKQEYIISVYEAKILNLEMLNMICECYKVLGGLNATTVLRQRKIIIDYPIK